MSKFYHGTSASSAARILREGFRIEKGSSVWTVSGEAIYFWSPEALIEAGEVEADYQEEQTIQKAKDSGEMALGRAKDCRLVVLEVELDETFVVEPDESCEYMDGAVCVFDNVPASAIRRVWISEDLSLLRGCFLAYHLNRDMSAVAYTLTPMEKKIAEAMSKAEIYPSDEDMLELTEYSLDLAREKMPELEN